MPVALIREAKAEAARRGTTLAAMVAESLTLALRGGSRQTRSDELRRDVAWYERNRLRLLEHHRGEYVAIVDSAVVDHDRDFEKLARRVFERYGTRSIFMPRVLDGGERIQIRSPSVRTRTQARARAVRRAP